MLECHYLAPHDAMDLASKDVLIPGALLQLLHQLQRAHVCVRQDFAIASCHIHDALRCHPNLMK